MTYNVIDDSSKLRITLLFMEVVKILEQRENLLRILDDSDTRMEFVVINSKQQQNIHQLSQKENFHCSISP
jgi:hypothetical protein